MYDPMSIKLKMTRHSMTLEKLSATTGVSAPAIRAVLRGGNTTTNTLDKIAKAFGCSEADFYLPTVDSKLSNKAAS